MKLLRSDPDRFIFQLGKREQRMLFRSLATLSARSPLHHRLARPGRLKDDDEAQRLLDDALGEQRRENRKQLLALLNDADRLRKTYRGLELTLAPAQMEWLLQVLNDVRVGSWLALGEPEEGETPRFDKPDAPYWVAMEVCGIYQSVLLSALGAQQSPEWH